MTSMERALVTLSTDVIFYPCSRRWCMSYFGPGWGRMIPGECSLSLSGIVVVLFEANAKRRHHIPKQRYRATNSAAYDAVLQQCGRMIVWFTDAAPIVRFCRGMPRRQLSCHLAGARCRATLRKRRRR